MARFVQIMTRFVLKMTGYVLKYFFFVSGFINICPIHERIKKNAQFCSALVNYDTVSRTAPATMGL